MLAERCAYIHIPFCSKRCSYCAFSTFDDKSELLDAYVEALSRDIQSNSSLVDLEKYKSVFIGGGTPSLLNEMALERIFSGLKIKDGAEVTIEANPESLTKEKCRIYNRVGINRLSIGIQSFDDQVLSSLGRVHNSETATSAIESAINYFNGRISIDLIYGSAGETVQSWTSTLKKAISFQLSHVSAYGLTIEENTALHAIPSMYPDDDDQANKYLVADELLFYAGYENYEISNWSKPGANCVQNQTYWEWGDYDGFGTAAHGHLGELRWWSVKDIEVYIKRISEGKSPIEDKEILSLNQQNIEKAQLTLRTSKGVPANWFSDEDLHLLSEFFTPIETCNGSNREERIKLNARGRLMAGEISTRLRLC